MPRRPTATGWGWASHSAGAPNTRYMTVQLPGVPPNQRNEYRYRPVLPGPEAFGDLTGHAVPRGAGPPAGARPARAGARPARAPAPVRAASRSQPRAGD